MKPAVRVERLAKCFQVRTATDQLPYRVLREDLMRLLTTPWRWLRRAPARADDFWALRDVSFDVQPGEAIGIIGRNGAGKSTLLKILSRIIKPSAGRARLAGRVGSLLEVGTGFHPELTGRENIFLSGSILGMRRAEIRRRFAEIVAFAEVEKFLDTPVKRYSSGMSTRLGFAIAAHLDPEILVIDEVLAVGDAQFQKRCLGKMGDVARSGRTILFVSHNMAAVRQLCGRALFLDGGRVQADGPVGEVIDAYHRVTLAEGTTAVRPLPASGVGFRAWQVREGAAGLRQAIYAGEPCGLVFQLEVSRPVPQAHFGLLLQTLDGLIVWGASSLDFGGTCMPLAPGKYEVEFAADSLPLRAGLYQVLVSANDLAEGRLDLWHVAPMLQVLTKIDPGHPAHLQGLLSQPGRVQVRPCADRGSPPPQEERQGEPRPAEQR